MVKLTLLASILACVGLDSNTRRIFWSEEAARIYGYPRDTEPTADLILQRAHPDDVDLVQEAIEGAAQGRNDFHYEHRLRMPDGSIKHLRDLAHRICDDAGNEQVVGAIMDITESKIAEEALRTQETRKAAWMPLFWRSDSGNLRQIFESRLRGRSSTERFVPIWVF